MDDIGYKLVEYEKRALKLLLGKRYDKANRLVASSKVLHHAIPTKNCDIVMTLPATTDDSTLMWLLARLRSRTPHIHVHVRHLRNTKVYGFYMTATYDNLLKGAEDLGICKPLRQEYGGGKREFMYDEQQCFEGVEEEEGFLTSQERESIVYHMLMNLRAEQGEVLGKVKFLEGQSIVPLLESKKIVTQVFPLHDSQPLTELRKSWVRSFCHKQPLGKMSPICLLKLPIAWYSLEAPRRGTSNEYPQHIVSWRNKKDISIFRMKKASYLLLCDRICEYFGVKIALYFAYLGHYTVALCFPTVLGIIFWFIQGENQVLDDICFVTFAMFNVFWPTLYLEHWQRRTRELAYQWGTLDQKGELLQDPRPLYTGDLMTSPVTGRLEPFYPSWKRNLFRYFISLPVIGVCLSVVFYIMLLIFELQEWVNDLVKTEEIPSLCRFLPKILLAMAIGVLDEIYKMIALWLNYMENYRMEETYENHLIIKLVLFQFVNSFLSLFYIAFYLQDMDRLRDQLAALLITRQVIGNLREAVIPFILWKMKLIKVGYDITAHMSPVTIEKEIKSLEREVTDDRLSHRRGSEAVILPKEIAEEGDVKVKTEENACDVDTRKDNSNEGHQLLHEKQAEEMKRHSSALILTQAEMESTMKKYEDTFDDYLEMFIQYGYVILFSSAFPLAALCALLNNVIEIRSDAFKLCMHHQRPFGKRVKNIGIWQDVLGVMGFIAIVVNTALIGVSGQIQRNNPDIDTTSIFIIIVVVEHILLVLKLCITYAIPPVPHWIEKEMARWEFKRREALKSLESQHVPSQMINKNATLSPVAEISVEIPQRKHPSSLSSLPPSVFNTPADKTSSSAHTSSRTSAGSLSSPSSPPPSSSSSSSFNVSLCSTESKNSSSLTVDKNPQQTNSKTLENVKCLRFKTDGSGDSKSSDSVKLVRTSAIPSPSKRQDIRQRILQSSRAGSQYSSRSDSAPKT